MVGQEQQALLHATLKGKKVGHVGAHSSGSMVVPASRKPTRLKTNPQSSDPQSSWQELEVKRREEGRQIKVSKRIP